MVLELSLRHGQVIERGPVLDQEDGHHAAEHPTRILVNRLRPPLAIRAKQRPATVVRDELPVAKWKVEQLVRDLRYPEHR